MPVGLISSSPFLDPISSFTTEAARRQVWTIVGMTLLAPIKQQHRGTFSTHSLSSMIYIFLLTLNKVTTLKALLGEKRVKEARLLATPKSMGVGLIVQPVTTSV